MRGAGVRVLSIMLILGSPAASAAGALEFGAKTSPSDPILEMDAVPRLCKRALAAMRTAHRGGEFVLDGNEIIPAAFTAVAMEETVIPGQAGRRAIRVSRADVDLEGTGTRQTVAVREREFNWSGSWHYAHVFPSPAAFEQNRAEWLDFEGGAESEYPTPASAAPQGRRVYPVALDASGKELYTGNMWAPPRFFAFEKRFYLVQGANYHEVQFPMTYTIFQLHAAGTMEPVCKVSQKPTEDVYAEFGDLPDVEALLRSIRVIGNPGPDSGTLHAETRHLTAAVAGERNAAARPWAMADRQETTMPADGQYHDPEYNVYGPRLDRFLELWSISEPWTRREYLTFRSLVPPAIESYSRHLVRRFGLPQRQARSAATRVLSGVLAQYITIPQSFDPDGPDGVDEEWGPARTIREGGARLRDLHSVLTSDPLFNSQNSFGKTALMTAAHLNRPDVVRELLAGHANVEARTHDLDQYGYFLERTGRTPLMYAAENAGPVVIDMLIDAGADTSAVDSQKNGMDFYVARNPRFHHTASPQSIQEIAKTADRAAGPSFDCDRAGSAIERAICASEVLRMLDQEIADTFARLKPLRGPEFLAEQRAWLRERDRACKPDDTDCLAEIMSIRARNLLMRVWETDGAN